MTASRVYFSHMAKRYWLVKSEADCYSIDDFRKDHRADWSGVRNYQARNFMRDGMKIGDLVLYHHSSADPTGIAGIARVSKPAHPDLTALDPKDDHYDPKATKGNPIWSNVELEFVEKFPRTLAMSELKKIPALKKMELFRPGQRLSVMPVTEAEFKTIFSMSKRAPTQA